MMRPIFLLASVLVTGCGAAATPRAEVPMVPITEDAEQPATRELDALGTWSEDAEYGSVWTPNDDTFVPYASDGQWVALGDETTFVSDVAWAQPTYKQGRWIARPTVSGTRWYWAPHARPASFMPADVMTRALRPDPLRVLDVANVETRARAEENAARMSEPHLLAMHSSAPAHATYESHFSSEHVASHFSSEHVASHVSSSSRVSSHFSSGHAHSHGRHR